MLGTLRVHTEVRKLLLPIPRKCHYVFNIRDFSRVIQGVLLSVPEATEGIDAMRRLWAHEVHRVYGDRLVDQTDRAWLFETICKTAEEQLHTTSLEIFGRFKESNKEVRQFLFVFNSKTYTSSIYSFQLEPEDLRKLMYCDFTNPKADTRNYLEVQDIEELRYVAESYLVEFNNMTKRPMNLVIFRYAIEHLSRICRVLKQPRSHALLIGIGGSGRQSYTRLAAHIMDFELFQIELSKNYSLKDWQNFLKAMLLKISTTEAHGVFLFADNQAIEKQFYEDINNLLKSGEILSLFDVNEIADICEKMLAIDKQRDKTLQTDGSPKALYNLFVSLIREQLHVILCMSPMGENFRNCVRNYPSIINNCTIDWFYPWPDDALEAVTSRFITDDIIDERNQAIAVKILKEFQQSSIQCAEQILEKHQIKIFIPPIAFVDSVNLFTSQIRKRKA